MGAVYRATHLGTKRTVAVKVIHPQLSAPVTAIMASLLYLKTRQAGGESLQDASDQFEALDIPRSKWQARMKSRLTTTRPPGSHR